MNVNARSGGGCADHPKALAGNTAASLFGVQAIVSALLGAALLMASRIAADATLAARAQTARSFVLAGMLMALLVEFAVAPRIVARENLALWHGVGSMMLLAQWVCAGVTFWVFVRPRRDAQV